MTIATWPAELPKPLREGFTLGYEDGRLSKGGEAPVPGFRGRFSRPARPQRMTMRLYPAERARFRRFFEEEIGRGAKPFLMSDPSRDGLPLLTMGGAPLLTTGGVPILLAARLLCTMTEMPVETPYGVRWQVQLSLAIMPV